MLSLENNDNNDNQPTNLDSAFSLGDDFNKIAMTDEGYEGAIVLEPDPGIYINDPITVLG